jgi:hypothetical protein
MALDLALALAALVIAEFLSAECAYAIGFAAVGLAAMLGQLQRQATLFVTLIAVAASLHVATTATACMAVLVLYYAVRCLLAESDATSAAVAAGLVGVGVAACGSLQLHDQFLRDSLLIAAITLVPASGTPVPQLLNRVTPIAAVVTLIACGFLALPIAERPERTAILQHGVWAKTDADLAQAPAIDQQGLYSYSELRRLLSAQVITDTDRLGDFDELWLITPTTPFTATEVAAITAWTKRGGRLIAITDHTDFLGHARCVNQVLAGMGMQVSDTAFFPKEASGKAVVALGSGMSLKTSNTASGYGLMPVVAARWIEEKPDYSGRNFFGPLSHSLDDRLRCRCIVGQKICGRGSVSVVADSTMLANFSVYFPDSIELINLARTARAGRVVAYAMPAILLVLVMCCRAGLRWLPAVMATACIGLSLLHGPIPVLRWDAPYLWSGDRTMMSDVHSPDESLSTAYAMFPYGGCQPRWVDKVPIDSSGIWVGTKPPPSESWRWLTPESATSPIMGEGDEILAAINPKPPVICDSEHLNRVVRYSGLWSNSAMGDWWVDSGISKAKRHRLDTFLAWSKGLPPPTDMAHQDARNLVDCELIVGGESRAEGRIVDVFGEEGEVYLGRGVSGRVEAVDGDKVIVGTPPLVEGWGVPSSWVIRRKKPL